MPRAVHRAASDDPALPLDALMTKADDVLHTLALLPIDHDDRQGAAARLAGLRTVAPG